MSTDDTDDGEPEDESVPSDVEDDLETGEGVSPRERIEEETDRAVESFDEGVVDLLAWVLDTETRARIYVYLRQNPDSTSKEVAEGTGLYPSTVREALAELHEDGTLTRRKRQSEGAGNNPYEYAAIPPSELVTNVVGEIQNELNAVFTLGGDGEDRTSEPVTITVEERGDDDETA